MLAHPSAFWAPSLTLPGEGVPFNIDALIVPLLETRMSTTVDEILDTHQQMIDMVRTYGANTDAVCDTWETRLYAWHDALLELSTSQQPGFGHTVATLQSFAAIEELNREITNFGNKIFKTETDRRSED